MRRVAALLLGAVLWIGEHAATAQQLVDPAFHPRVDHPRYAAGTGPRVFIDAAHLNFHTAEGGYAPFADLLRRDGYRVESSTAPFTAESLARMDVLAIVNALHPQSKEDLAPLPTFSAFTDEEIAAVEKWVRNGGRLLLIADHMPLAGHAESLAAKFGIRFINGFAMDSNRRGILTFRRSDGSLPDSAASDGRGASDRVNSVMSFSGQAFRVDASVKSQPLLVLGETHQVLFPQVAFQFSDKTPHMSAAGLLQGVLVEHGAGRVAAFGEAAMFTAQIAGPEKVPVGMNAPPAGENYRFALNVMHWLK